jgi:hypothetical protein
MGPIPMPLIGAAIGGVAIAQKSGGQEAPMVHFYATSLSRLTQDIQDIKKGERV